MTAHLPHTSEIRSVYASSQEPYYSEEVGSRRVRLTYPERAAGFDAWLNATIAYAEAQAYARGKADGKTEAAADVAGDTLRINVDPRVVVSVPKTMRNTFGAPHPGEEGYMEELENDSDKPEGYAEGKAAGVEALVSHIKTRLDNEASLKLTGAGRSHQAARDSAFSAANFIVTTSAKEILER